MTDPSAVAYPIDLSERPWSIRRGDAARYPIADGIGDADAGVITTPVDLTLLGDTWTCQIRRGYDGAPYDVAVDDGLAGSGQLMLAISGDLTSDMSPRLGVDDGSPDYTCDVQVEGGDVSPLTVYSIPVYLSKDSTHG